MATRIYQETRLDEILREAVSNHQRGRLADAETQYREILVRRPDFAEIHINLGVVLMSRGDLDGATNSCQRGIALKPTYAKGHYYLGDILAFRNKLYEAADCYRRALAINPQYAEAHNNLGNVYLRLGKSNEAALSYKSALAINPNIAVAHNNLGHIYLQSGNFDQALTEFSCAVTISPTYADAHNNLGYIYLQQGRQKDALQEFKAAIAAKPDYAEAHNNCGIALGMLDRLDDAAASCRRAIAINPNYAAAHNNLGTTLQKLSDLEQAEACFRKALSLNPDFAEVQKNLGVILCERGRTAESLEFFARQAEMVYGRSPYTPGPAFKNRHDAEQRAWLGGPTYHVGDGSRINGPAVNPDNRVEDITAQWRTAQPQLVVVDNLLTPQALQKLRAFCLDSTIWHEIYEDGYLGAFPEHGFAPQLLAQIAEELRAVYPAIIEDHPLLHFWAFKYDSSLSGIKTHADFAAINVNFWITPDEANLDLGNGGLVVWDAAAPADWDFAKYNAASEDINAFLRQADAKPMRVPYRANRAVIFDSDLFHETDTIHFKPGYENRRINVTLLFGRRCT